MDNIDEINTKIEECFQERHFSVLYLSQLHSIIESKVTASHKQIIAKLFAKLKTDHKLDNWKTCKCELCNMHRQYVYEKIQLQKLKRMTDWGGEHFNEDLSFFNAFFYVDVEKMNDYDFLMSKIVAIKEQISKRKDRMEKII